MVTTKRRAPGIYFIFVNGVYSGYIDRWANESGEWSCFDALGEWMVTTGTKRQALTMYE